MPLKLERSKQKRRISESIPDTIYALRREKGWTQKELANRLGVEPTTVARWEMGEREPDKWSVIPMLLMARGSVQSIFEGIVGRTREEILGDIGLDAPTDAESLAAFGLKSEISNLRSRHAPSARGSLSPSTRQQLHTALDLILDRAPETMKNKVTEVLESAAGKYSGKK